VVRALRVRPWSARRQIPPVYSEKRTDDVSVIQNSVCDSFFSCVVSYDSKAMLFK
jgi:hypothetical protein